MQIVGGLLVLTLLSRPVAIKIDYIAYEILRSQTQIMQTLKKGDIVKNLHSDEEGEADKIEELIANIDSNTRSIMGLLKEKNKVVGQLETSLDIRAYAKKTLDEAQIQKLSAFSALYSEKGEALRNSLQKIEEKQNLNLVKKEILHTDSDLNYIYKELKELSDYQDEALYSLQSIVLSGAEILSEL